MRLNPWTAKGRLEQGLPPLGMTESIEVAVPPPVASGISNAVLDLGSLSRLK